MKRRFGAQIFRLDTAGYAAETGGGIAGKPDRVSFRLALLLAMAALLAACHSQLAPPDPHLTAPGTVRPP